jgi:hypothetical protein
MVSEGIVGEESLAITERRIYLVEGYVKFNKKEYNFET